MLAYDYACYCYRLRKELVRANDLVNVSKKPQLTAEELEEMHPTAAMTSKFLKSGLTLTEVICFIC